MFIHATELVFFIHKDQLGHINWVVNFSCDDLYKERSKPCKLGKERKKNDQKNHQKENKRKKKIVTSSKDCPLFPNFSFRRRKTKNRKGKKKSYGRAIVSMP